MCPPKYASIESSLFFLSPSDLPELAGPAPSAAISGPTNVRHRLRGDRAHLQCQRGGAAEGGQEDITTILVLTINVVAGAADDVLVALLVARGPAHAQLVLADRLLILGALALHHPPPPPPCAFTISR